MQLTFGFAISRDSLRLVQRAIGVWIDGSFPVVENP